MTNNRVRRSSRGLSFVPFIVYTHSGILHLSRYAGVGDLREVVLPAGAIHRLVCLPFDRADLITHVAQDGGEVQVLATALVVIRIILGFRYADLDPA